MDNNNGKEEYSKNNKFINPISLKKAYQVPKFDRIFQYSLTTHNLNKYTLRWILQNNKYSTI